MTATVRTIGRRVTVVIPAALARTMALTDGTALEVTGTADAIVMRKPGRRPRRSLEQIVAAIKPASYRRRREELGDDAPVGKEQF